MERINRCIEDCLNYAPLPKQEEMALIQEYKETRNPRIKTRIIESNLRLVYTLAKRTARNWECHYLSNDLFQEGTLGLMQALEKLDLNFGKRLGEYAPKTINSRMRDYLLRNKKCIAYKASSSKRALEQGYGFTQLSLDAKLSEDTDKTLLSRLKSDSLTEDDIIALLDAQGITKKGLIRYADKELSPNRQQRRKELMIINNRLLTPTPITLEYIGKAFGVTREMIRLTEAKIYKKLRRYSKKCAREAAA